MLNEYIVPFYFKKFIESSTDKVPQILQTKRSCKIIISHFSDADFFYDIICKTKNLSVLDKIWKLLKTASVNSDIQKQLCISLLKFYYGNYDCCSDGFINFMQSYLREAYTENYYFGQKDFIPILKKSDSGETDFSNFLQNIKLNPFFISTKFYQELWPAWCVSRKADSYTESFLKENKTRINAESEDYRKCILAVITCKIYSRKNEDLIKNSLIPFFGTSNPAEPNFWTVSNENLRKNYQQLQQAPIIYYKYFTKQFLEIFFDALATGNYNNSVQTERSLYWEKYIDEIEDFRIAVTSKFDKILRSQFSKMPGDVQMYINFYKNKKVSISVDSSPASFIMKIRKYMIVEYTEYGNAGYMYYKSSNIANEVFSKQYLEDSRDLKNYHDNSGVESTLRKIIHDVGWQYKVDRYLLT